MKTEIKPEEVEILESPWTGGRTIESYHGPVSDVVRVCQFPRETMQERVAEAILEVTERIKARAAALGANALASPGMEIDPFGPEIEIRLGASAFDLRPLGFRRPPAVITAFWPSSPWL